MITPRPCSADRQGADRRLVLRRHRQVPVSTKSGNNGIIARVHSGENRHLRGGNVKSGYLKNVDCPAAVQRRIGAATLLSTPI
ncbi:MAG: hypothetical protein V8S97_06770 [Oscillospiraceae bacterium]